MIRGKEFGTGCTAYHQCGNHVEGHDARDLEGRGIVGHAGLVEVVGSYGKLWTYSRKTEAITGVERSMITAMIHDEPVHD
jgi:hypothetical protein